MDNTSGLRTPQSTLGLPSGALGVGPKYQTETELIIIYFGGDGGSRGQEVACDSKGLRGYFCR